MSKTQIRAKVARMEADSGILFTDNSPNGCVPGTCNCPTRYARCRAWDLFEQAIREASNEPEPAPKPIINKYGQDVTGRIYPSRTAAMNDLYGSLCE